MTSGSSAGSTRVPTRPSQASTNSSPTGSPTSSRSTRCRVRTPIRDITSRNRVRVGFSPTSVIVSSEPLSAAAATRKAAEDGSPGHRPGEAVVLEGSQRDAARRGLHGRAERRERSLGVVARRRRLLDDGLPLGPEAGQQHCALHLRAGDRRPVVDPAQGAALDLDRGVPVRRPHAGAHLAERRRHPLHRPRPQARIAGEGRADRETGEQTGQQPHRRARVPAVEVGFGLQGGETALTLDLKRRIDPSGHPPVPRGTVTLGWRGIVPGPTLE